jgi:acid phosphatase
VSQRVSHVWQCNATEFQLFGDRHSRPTRVHVTFGHSIFLGDCHFAQLIGRGAEALLRLGAYFRSIYVIRLKFLPTHFVSSAVRFRSTLTHRTVHSAMAMIKGLYPERFDGEIYVADKSLDHWRKSSLVCPRLKDRISELRESPEYVEAFSAGVEQLKRVGQILHCKSGTAPDIALTTRCDGRPLGLNLTEEALDSVAYVKAAQQSYVFRHSAIYPLMFSFSMSDIVNAMIGRLNGEDGVKFIHWSAHDGNILGFLGYLGVSAELQPPYGSYIVTELWKCRKSGQLLVRFIYNGRVLEVPRMGGMRVVEFRRLVHFVREKMPDLVTDCGFQVGKFASGNVFKTD